MPTVDDRAHENLCDFTRFLTRLDPAARLVDRDGLVAAIGQTDSPAARTAVRADRSLPAAQWAALAVEEFAKGGATGCVFARVGADDDLTDALVECGFHEWSRTPEMVCEQRLESREPPPDVKLRLATSADDVSAYADIAGRAFTHLSIPASVTRHSVDNAEVMLQSDCAIALADLDGVPVAGALVVLFGEQPIGYVGWVACVDEARGRGLGDTVTRAVTNEAFERGADLVTLEASQFGEHTYARMGYREIYRYRVLIKI